MKKCVKVMQQQHYFSLLCTTVFVFKCVRVVFEKVCESNAAGMATLFFSVVKRRCAACLQVGISMQKKKKNPLQKNHSSSVPISLLKSQVLVVQFNMPGSGAIVLSLIHI